MIDLFFVIKNMFFFNHLAVEERADCFALFVFLLPCGCTCLCSVSLPRDAVYLSVVRDCGISGHTYLSLESSIIHFLNRNRERHKLTDMTKLYISSVVLKRKGACPITCQIKQILSVKRLFIFKIL